LGAAVLSSCAQECALKFDGSTSYVNFGTNVLGATNFTLECSFKRTGTGLTGNTGTGGISGIPLITRGRPRPETSLPSTHEPSFQPSF
jgi:hypothetical protein